MTDFEGKFDELDTLPLFDIGPKPVANPKTASVPNLVPTEAI